MVVWTVTLRSSKRGCVVVRGVLQGAGVDLGGQLGQVLLPGPGPRRRDQDLVGGVPARGRDLAGPPADGGGHRVGEHVALGQRRDDPGVAVHPAGPGQVGAGGGPGDPGLVDQPGGGAVVGVGGVAAGGGERGQDPGPGRGADRVVLLLGAQVLGLGLGGHRGRVGGGQVVLRGARHGHRLAHAGESGGGGGGAHRGHLRGRGVRDRAGAQEAGAAALLGARGTGLDEGQAGPFGRIRSYDLLFEFNPTR